MAFSCPLHQWFSHESPCPACVTTVTSAEICIPIDEGNKPLPANDVDKRAKDEAEKQWQLGHLESRSPRGAFVEGFKAGYKARTEPTERMFSLEDMIGEWTYIGGIFNGTHFDVNKEMKIHFKEKFGIEL